MQGDSKNLETTFLDPMWDLIKQKESRLLLQNDHFIPVDINTQLSSDILRITIGLFTRCFLQEIKAINCLKWSQLASPSPLIYLNFLVSYSENIYIPHIAWAILDHVQQTGCNLYCVRGRRIEASLLNHEFELLQQVRKYNEWYKFCGVQDRDFI